MTNPSLQSLNEEMGLVLKLKSLNTDIDPFCGLTTFAQRRDIVRRSIANNRLEDVVYAVQNGKHVTLAHQFHRAYGVVL